MNYIIEGGIDFYGELNKDEIAIGPNAIGANEIGPNEIGPNEIDPNASCLISKEPLKDNFITLPCKHTFNYVPLYKEVILQKSLYNSLETTKLLPYQIKCPYCRLVINNLLPYLPIDPSVQKLPNINYPLNKCLKHLDCSYTYKSGKSKDSCCTKTAYKMNNLIYCDLHWKLVNEVKKPKKEEPSFIWTEEMQKMAKEKTIIELKNIIRKMKLPVSGNKKQLVARIINKI